jgi:hypothetical protein
MTPRNGLQIQDMLVNSAIMFPPEAGCYTDGLTTL